MAERKEMRIVVRVAAPLRSELKRAAQEDGRTLAEIVRQALIDFAARRFVEREAA
jgi:hypothetical protein